MILFTVFERTIIASAQLVSATTLDIAEAERKFGEVQSALLNIGRAFSRPATSCDAEELVNGLHVSLTSISRPLPSLAGTS